MVQIIEKKQYIIKESGIPCAGSGLFAKRDISPGTILPYNTFVKKYSISRIDKFWYWKINNNNN